MDAGKAAGPMSARPVRVPDRELLGEFRIALEMTSIVGMTKNECARRIVRPRARRIRPCAARAWTGASPYRKQHHRRNWGIHLCRGCRAPGAGAGRSGIHTAGMITCVRARPKLSVGFSSGSRHNGSMRPVDEVRERVRAEYLEMPGLQLTLDQVQRLCGIDRRVCRTVLDGLVAELFLCVKPNGTYARAWDGHHPRPAQAVLRNAARARRAS